MVKRLLLVCLLVLAIAPLMGCPKEEPPPPPPPAPPEPTAQEIAAKIRPALDALKTQGYFQDALLQPMLDELKKAKNENQNKENGKAALSQISIEIVDLVNAAAEKKGWKYVLAGIAAYEVLNPESTRFARTKEIATLQVNKPKVTVKGFFVDQAAGGQLYAFLEVFDPKTNVTETWKARLGEEKYNLRFVDIVGDQKGVTLEYLAIPGDLFDVMK